MFGEIPFFVIIQNLLLPGATLKPYQPPDPVEPLTYPIGWGCGPEVAREFAILRRGYYSGKAAAINVTV